MNREYLIQLINNLYRLTLLFPKKEPLRYKMREMANEILTKCLRSNLKQNLILEELEILDAYFEVAKAQNWVSPVELLRLQEEYNRIKAEIKKIPKKPLPEREVLAKTVEVKPRQIGVPSVGMKARQEKILEFLKENGRAQVWQLKQIFPEVSKRTLRRDFEFLLKQGKIERIGKRNDTFYQLKS